MNDRMNGRRRFSPPAVGGSSLIVIFAVLCLTVFALMSLSTAQNSARIGDAAAQAVIGYYEADCQAEQILARLRAGECPNGVKVEGNTASYSCPVNDTQSLYVSVALNQDGCQILMWKMAPTQEWHAEDHLDVWKGNEGE